MRGRLALLAAAAALALIPASAHGADAPWKAADRVTDGLFDAQTELVLGDQTAAAKDIGRARDAYAGDLREALRAADPDADEAINTGLQDAADAAREDDQTALAAARGATRAGLFRAAYSVITEATTRGDAATAKRWILLREYRTATRFTRPGAQATLALDQLQRRKIAPKAAEQAVEKDLLDAYQARLRELLNDARNGIKKDFPARRAESAAQAAGYFAILAPRYAEDRGQAAEAQASKVFDALPETVDLGPALDAADRALEGFTAAPFTPEEAARRAQQ